MRTDEYRRMYEAEDSFWWYAGLRALLRRVIAKSAASHGRAPRLLDAGCGTGANLAMLEEFGEGIGVDLSSTALEFSKRRGLTGLVRSSLLNLPFASGSFDAILSIDVLYHLWVADDSTALAELARVLKPRGTLILQVAAFEFLRGSHDTVVFTRKRYTRREVRNRVEAAGLKVQRITYRNSLLFPFVAAARLLRRKEETAASDVQMPGRFINSVLCGVLAIENAILSIMSLPVGSSVFCMATKEPQ
ncbi:MAG: class I SAM-dependent methyltransferase [Ignavibacteriales bacterium CG07_land_8_20_14_0_80_59_12]|nr:MAG: class I SAM-dependent methyltransferase [Ignavibacteriales bacterium CG07_land_8_20_14_0_80_59_12]